MVTVTVTLQSLRLGSGVGAGCRSCRSRPFFHHRMMTLSRLGSVRAGRPGPGRLIMPNLLHLALLVSGLGSSAPSLRPNALTLSSSSGTSSGSSLDDSQVVDVVSKKRRPEDEILRLKKKLKSSRRNLKLVQEEAARNLKLVKEEAASNQEEAARNQTLLENRNKVLDGTAFVKAHELGCSIRGLECDQKPIPKHRTPAYLKKEVDFIPPDSIVYSPKRNESRANIQKIKQESNEDIFGNNYTSIQSVPVAHLYPHSFQCRPYLADLFTFFYGLDQNNSTISKENALRFLFGFKKTQNGSGCLIHSAMQQKWNYIRLIAQAEFLDSKPQIFILSILPWLNQLCWNGYSGFCAIYLTNCSDAYVGTGACKNATFLFWDNPEHRNQIILALEAFADGCLDILRVQCSSDIPVTKLFENKICGRALEAIKNDNKFQVFNISEIPAGAVFRLVTFKDGCAPNPTLLTMKSCNSLVNLKFHQNAISKLACTSQNQVAIAVPGCV